MVEFGVTGMQVATLTEIGSHLATKKLKLVQLFSSLESQHSLFQICIYLEWLSNCFIPHPVFDQKNYW